MPASGSVLRRCAGCRVRRLDGRGDTGPDLQELEHHQRKLEILTPIRATVVAAMGHLSFRSFVIEKSLPSQAKVGYDAFETIEHAAATPVGEF